MAYRFTRIEKTVSALVLGIGLLFIGLFVLLGRHKEWFKRKNIYYSYFNDSSSLEEGMPVKFKGFQIGTVRDITLLPQKNEDVIKVKVIIKKEYEKRLKKGSVLKLNTSFGVLGSATLDLKRGYGRGYIRPGEIIYSDHSHKGQILLSNMNLQKNFYIENLESILLSVKAITTDIQKSIAPFGSIMHNLDRTTSALSATLNNVNNQNNSINRFLNDQGTIYKKFDNMLINFRSVSNRVDDISAESAQLIRTLNRIAHAVEKHPLLGSGSASKSRNKKAKNKKSKNKSN
jgi:phospholipid/cholesterol/gamma-HCH transport system substrate-binding protein